MSVHQVDAEFAIGVLLDIEEGVPVDPADPRFTISGALETILEYLANITPSAQQLLTYYQELTELVPRKDQEHG